MTIFPTVTSPPKGTQSPLTFQAEHSEAVPWRGWGCAVGWSCRARHSCLPAHLPGTHCQRAGQPASAWDHRKPLPNPQLSGLSCWHLPISHTLFHTIKSARIILESEGRGSEQSSLFLQSRGGWSEDKSTCLSSLAAFSMAADGAPHVTNNTHTKAITGLSLTVCYSWWLLFDFGIPLLRVL